MPDRTGIGPIVVLLMVLLVLGPLLSIPTRSTPTSNFGVGVHLDEYSIEMLVSTEKDQQYKILGWVDVSNMRPGETVAVTIEASGYNDIYGTPDPNYLRYERDGRQYFNLTVTLKEDAPIHEDFEIVVSAEGRTYLDYEISYVELTVTPTFQFTATANVIDVPGETEQGGEAKGVLRVTNTGSIYGEYSLELASGPDSVVNEVRFTRPSDLTPGFHDDFPFVLELAEDAPTGKHRVTIELWGETQYETSGLLDTVTVEVRVREASIGGAGSLIAVLLVIVAAVGVATYVLRRKA